VKPKFNKAVFIKDKTKDKTKEEDEATRIMAFSINIFAILNPRNTFRHQLFRKPRGQRLNYLSYNKILGLKGCV